MLIGNIDEIIADIGAMLKAERLYRNLSQQTVADRSGISLTAVKRLEGGKGATLETFVRVCRTLRKDDWIMRLGPAAAMSPEDYVKRPDKPPRQRAGRRTV